MKDGFARAAELIRGSSMTVALTGAGISVPSGIPDFRSPGFGLWERFDPFEYATIEAFLNTPEKFFEFLGQLKDTLSGAKPNGAHAALARLEGLGKLNTVVTQNIDNLHQMGGSRNVVELHGNASRAFCYSCGERFSADDLEGLAVCGVPRCVCGGVIKPDVILFGEALPVAELEKAQDDCRQCDVLLVVGSSLTVAPASLLPQVAAQGGASIIIVNKLGTYMDSRASLVIRDDAAEVLPAIADLLG